MKKRRGTDTDKGDTGLENVAFAKRIKTQRKIYDVGGSKSISSFGAYVYLLNICLRDLLALPTVVVLAGWLPCLGMNVLIWFIATSTCLMVLRAMTMIEGNQNFERRFEFVSAAQHYLGDKAAAALEIGFHAQQILAFFAMNHVSHFLDLLFIKVFGMSLGLQLYPTLSLRVDFGESLMAEGGAGDVVPLCLTAGYVVSAVIITLAARYNLDDSMRLQYAFFSISFPTTVFILAAAAWRFRHANVIETHGLANGFFEEDDACLLAKLGDFLSNDSVCWSSPLRFSKSIALAPRLPRVLGERRFELLLGVFLNAFSFTTAMPSWANEVQADVRITKTLWASTTTAFVVYSVAGYLLATVFPVAGEGWLMDLLHADVGGSVLMIAVIMSEVGTNLPGLIVNCVATRYNLVNSGLVATDSRAWLLASVVPLSLVWMLAGHERLAYILESATLFASLCCNFVVPAFLYVVAYKTSSLAYRDASRHKTVRYGISAFKPTGAKTVGEVQQALRRWATFQTSEDPNLRALLGNRHCRTGVFQAAPRQRAERSGSSPAGFGYRTLWSWVMQLRCPSVDRSSDDDAVGNFDNDDAATGPESDNVPEGFRGVPVSNTAVDVAPTPADLSYIDVDSGASAPESLTALLSAYRHMQHDDDDHEREGEGRAPDAAPRVVCFRPGRAGSGQSDTMQRVESDPDINAREFVVLSEAESPKSDGSFLKPAIRRGPRQKTNARVIVIPPVDRDDLASVAEDSDDDETTSLKQAEDEEAKYQETYECPLTGKIKQVRINVFPDGIMRRHHLHVTYGIVAVLLGLWICTVCLSVWHFLSND